MEGKNQNQTTFPVEISVGELFEILMFFSGNQKSNNWMLSLTSN